MKLAITLSLFVLSPAAMARSQYMGDIPNSDENSCDTCHTNGGGSGRNRFGRDYAQFPDWQDLYQRDSDGDGCSNGVELGDPSGDFITGGTSPGAYRSNPSDGSDCEDSGGDSGGGGKVIDGNTGCSVTGSSAAGGALALVLGLMQLRRRK